MARILHIITTARGVGGAEVVLAALVRGAREEGHHVLVVNPLGAPDDALSRLCAPVPVRVRVGRSIRSLPGARRWLARQVADFDPDVVHVHLVHALLLVATLPKGRRRWILSHQHGAHLVLVGSQLEARLERLAAPRFDRVVAISRSVEAFLLSGYGYSREQVVLIYNGWQGDPLPSQPSPDPRAVCIANFRPEKAHDILVDAFAQVLRDVPEATLVLLGDGPLWESVRDRAERLGIAGALQMPGAVDDVWPHLAAARVFVLASRSEPLGIAAMEAMAAGLPVVATSIGGLQELVDDGRSGLLVPPDDVPALASALGRLLADPDLARSMGARGAEAAGRMGMGAMVDAYLALYGELLADVRPRRG